MDRTMRRIKKAFVRKGDEIELLEYYSTGNGDFVDDGEVIMTIVRAVTGRRPKSREFKMNFFDNDPELKKVRDLWVCQGCRRITYQRGLQYMEYGVFRGWLQHKLRCQPIQNKLKAEYSQRIDWRDMPLVRIGPRKRAGPLVATKTVPYLRPRHVCSQTCIKLERSCSDAL